jgi:hypothetical protein
MRVCGRGTDVPVNSAAAVLDSLCRRRTGAEPPPGLITERRLVCGGATGRGGAAIASLCLLPLAICIRRMRGNHKRLHPAIRNGYYNYDMASKRSLSMHMVANFTQIHPTLA